MLSEANKKISCDQIVWQDYTQFIFTKIVHLVFTDNQIKQIIFIRRNTLSDFRISVESPDPDFELELDWDGQKGEWTLSEKEIGLGQRWIENIAPSSEHLNHLVNFFMLDKKIIERANVLKLSPGELTILHHNQNKDAHIHAHLCDICGKHWYIFRWVPDRNQWVIYGRTCEFTWRRGDNPTEEEKKMLTSIAPQLKL